MQASLRSPARTALAKARAVRAGAEARQGFRGSINSFGLILAIAAVFALLIFATRAIFIFNVQASAPTELIAHVVSVLVGAEGFAPAALLWLVGGVGVFACRQTAGKTASEPEFRHRLETARLEQIRAGQALVGGDGGLVISQADRHAHPPPTITSERPANAAAARALAALATAAKRVSLSTTQSSSSLRLVATADAPAFAN